MLQNFNKSHNTSPWTILPKNGDFKITQACILLKKILKKLKTILKSSLLKKKKGPNWTRNSKLINKLIFKSGLEIVTIFRQNERALQSK